MFPVHNLSIGVHIQIHKLILPPSVVDNQYFNRSTLEFLEVPLVLKYKFGPGRRTFIELQGAPEFHPRFHPPSGYPLPNPNLDHAYFVRGSLGYDFGKWYAKGTYETRYFKWEADPLGNPSGLYNWRTNAITGGIGVNF